MNTNRWRTIDIVIASIVAVAFGVIFWAWGLLYNGPADAIPLPGRALLYGVWLVPAVLGALIVRKPGAAFYTLSLAALVSVAIGTSWGWTIAVQGPLEALGAELVFALFAYKVYRLPVALLAGAAAGIVAAVYDVFVWYPDTAWGSFRIPYVLLTAASALVIAGLGSVLLTRALAQTGVLDRFPAGRSRALV
ncbi:ABC transporter permease [Paractinoplanes abujensis]|uniref:Energy-coupling factor transport system substrate-specific component n=1 Tax=Paractinoplanes abujensis TaxID=882441 RepID=A0A7W7CU18_9ACTN|nr:ECF transporter S component [Actinoplanes abujensis]MBB4694678.1 energy-coupling factor transport system substrate-specific component [Actinoplanes abujensis]GID20109.1 ABC transporter permease [Actinoplanes abujensis]